MFQLQQIPSALKSRFSVRNVFFLLGGIPLAYLVLANLLLNCRLLPLIINQHSEQIYMTWSSAWSPWPGRVHVRNYYIRNQLPDLQWEIAVDKADTLIALSALLQHRFETRWVVAKGVAFRARPRIADDEDTAAVSSNFPPIRGFEGPPLRSDKADFVPKKVWSARLEGVQVNEVREAWVGAYRVALDAKVTGRFFLAPKQSADVGPAVLTIARAEVFQGKARVARDLKGKLQFLLDAKNLIEADRIGIVRYIDGTASLEGELTSLDLLNYHLVDRVHPDFSGGRARFEIGLAATKGFLIPGSQIKLEGSDFSAELPGYRIKGRWNAYGLVKLHEGAVRSTMELNINPMRVERESGAVLVESPGLKLEGFASNILLGALPKDGNLTVTLAPTTPFAVTLLNPFIKSDSFKFEAGKATVHAKLQVGPGGPVRGGSLVLRAKRIEATWSRTRMRGDVNVDLDLTRLRLLRKSVDLSGSTISLTNIGVVNSRDHPRDWSGKVKLEAAALSLKPTMGVSAGITGEFSDARPFLALFGDQAGLPAWTTPLLEAQGLSISGTVALLGSQLDLRNLSAVGTGLQIQGRLTKSEASTAGLFLVKVRGFELGLKVGKKDVEKQLLEPEQWYQAQLVAGAK